MSFNLMHTDDLAGVLRSLAIAVSAVPGVENSTEYQMGYFAALAGVAQSCGLARETGYYLDLVKTCRERAESAARTDGRADVENVVAFRRGR